MYDRQVGDKVYKFVVSGLLWNKSLVMNDLETRSQWSHILGVAQKGKLKGAKLKTYPAVITNFKTWSAQHPKSTVLAMAPLTFAYNSEYIQRRPSNFVVGLRKRNARPKAWRLDQLKYQPILNDTFESEPIVVCYQADSATASIFNRTVNGTVLHFEKHELGMIDSNTQTIWDSVTGIAVEGKLVGSHLVPRVAIPSFFDAWRDFHRDSKYWAAPKELVEAAEQKESSDSE